MGLERLGTFTAMGRGVYAEVHAKTLDKIQEPFFFLKEGILQ